MPENLDDPSALSKDKLKSELLARNVELPGGNPTKDAFVQLYLRELSGHKVRRAAAGSDGPDGFSSDEELPSRKCSSGRKPTPRGETAPLDVTVLTDQSLREELLSLGLEAGPIVASTRKLYEKKLQKLLDAGRAPPEVIPADPRVAPDGGADPELYSDQDDEVAESRPEPKAAPEPAPAAERPPRSRGKGPVAAPSPSTQHATVEKIAASEQSAGPEEERLQKERPPFDLSGPARISATCRRPIRGAAERPVRSSLPWGASPLFSPNATQTPAHAEARLTGRLAGVPRSSPSPSPSSSSRPVFAAPPATTRRSPVPWRKLLLLALLAALLFLVYQAMEPNSISPFDVVGVGGPGGGPA